MVGPAALSISASSASATYGGTHPGHHGVVLGLRERGQPGVADQRADVLDHGHVVEPGGHLPELVLGRGRPQLHDQLRDGTVQVDDRAPRRSRRPRRR